MKTTRLSIFPSLNFSSSFSQLPLSSLILTFLTFLTFLSANAQVPSYVPTTGLVGYWPFNGNANDESGNGYNGTITGTSFVQDRLGNQSAAMEFMGSTVPNTDNTVVAIDQGLDIINFNYQFTQELSVNMWANTYSTTNGDVLNKRTNNDIDFVCTLSASNSTYFHLGPAGSVYDDLTTVSLGQWHMYTYVFELGQMRTYVDGQLVSEALGSVPLNNNTNFIKIGKYVYFGGNTHYYYYNGILDDIGIWNRALTQEDVANLYNSCVPSLYYNDTDGDGFGAGDALNTCNPPAGYVLNNTDCNDANANQNEGVSEICNNQDDNCNSLVDEGLTFQDYYTDADFDGFGTGAAQSSCIDMGIDFTLNNTDCDDSNAAINPNAEEIGANGIDENCDGQIDNSIEELSNQWILYPNPATTELNLQITTDLIGTDLFVFDALGKQILKQQILSTNTTINTSSFVAGNYVVKVGGGVKKFEVVK